MSYAIELTRVQSSQNLSTLVQAKNQKRKRSQEAEGRLHCISTNTVQKRLRTSLTDSAVEHTSREEVAPAVSEGLSRNISAHATFCRCRHTFRQLFSPLRLFASSLRCDCAIKSFHGIPTIYNISKQEDRRRRHGQHPHRLRARTQLLEVHPPHRANK